MLKKVIKSVIICLYIKGVGNLNSREKEFYKYMIEITEKCKTKGYNPTYFLQMLNKKGIMETSKSLINSKTYSEGFTKLWEMDKLGWSLEYTVVAKFNDLFTDEEIKICINRLREYNFEV